MATRPPLFGTNGVRGVANQTLTPELALRLGRAMGSYWDGGRVLLGGDARLSTPMFTAAVSAGLQASGCEVVEAGTGPTPALQLALKQGKFAGGCIVTASHNPPEYNGIKAVDKDGTELSRAEEERIEAHYYDERFKVATWDQLRAPTTLPGVNERYVDTVLASVDREAIAKRKFRVVMDCSNGAACYTAPYLLRKLGCHVISLNANPDGAFPGHESEPVLENAKQLMATVQAMQADLGAIQDGDADRAIFVDEGGRYVLGDLSLAMMAANAVRKHRGGLVVTPVSSSACVEDMVKAAGGHVEYTKVGSPAVAHAMKQKNAIFGGEENGGLIFPEHQHVRDGLLSIARVLELMAHTGKPLSSLLAEVPKYTNVKTKVHIPPGAAQAIQQKFAASQKGRVDTTDGVKVYTDEGWILVRPSGTEPLIRIYAESKREDAARKLNEAAKAQIERIAKEMGGSAGH